MYFKIHTYIHIYIYIYIYNIAIRIFNIVAQFNVYRHACIHVKLASFSFKASGRMLLSSGMCHIPME